MSRATTLKALSLALFLALIGGALVLSSIPSSTSGARDSVRSTQRHGRRILLRMLDELAIVFRRATFSVCSARMSRLCTSGSPELIIVAN